MRFPVTAAALVLGTVSAAFAVGADAIVGKYAGPGVITVDRKVDGVPVPTQSNLAPIELTFFEDGSADLDVIATGSWKRKRTKYTGDFSLGYTLAIRAASGDQNATAKAKLRDVRSYPEVAVVCRLVVNEKYEIAGTSVKVRETVELLLAYQGAP